MVAFREGTSKEQWLFGSETAWKSVPCLLPDGLSPLTRARGFLGQGDEHCTVALYPALLERSSGPGNRPMVNTQSFHLALEGVFTAASSAQHPAHPPATQTHPALPGTALWLGAAVGISSLDRQQVVIVPGVRVTFPKPTQPFCRHDLIGAPGTRQGGQLRTLPGR